jgi:hypothetical protein
MGQQAKSTGKGSIKDLFMLDFLFLLSLRKGCFFSASEGFKKGETHIASSSTRISCVFVQSAQYAYNTRILWTNVTYA